MGPYGNLITNWNLTAAKSKTILLSSTEAYASVMAILTIAGVQFSTLKLQNEEHTRQTFGLVTW